MGIFDRFTKAVTDQQVPNNAHGVIETGKNKKTGGHNHTTNTGDDRTPAQKAGDKKRKKTE
ncbi:hypothetical protein [Psychrobacter immobilis]|uniref:hypothetical protein n=1 Tax=Psychrobacter immobilis TaxID=498 RepID=UPI00191ADF01|nr:hypothetical protein [Psychrobacter immobilis]